MRDSDCVWLLRAAVPRLGLRYEGLRRVRGQACKRIDRRMRELGLDTARAYRSFLEEHPGEWAVLDACCRISISRFWRDRAVWDALAARVVPELARLAARRGEEAVCAWSAGCASGEEPYSLRLLWDLRLARRHPGLSLDVVATDADPQLLARARRARYRASSLRELPTAWRRRAFEAPRGTRGEAALRADLRHGIAFRCQDLRTRMPRGPFHLVLCRNLAFTYFAEALQRDVLAELARRIVPGGALVLGLHEALPETEDFAPWAAARAVWRRRSDSGSPSQPAVGCRGLPSNDVIPRRAVPAGSRRAVRMASDPGGRYPPASTRLLIPSGEAEKARP